MIVASLLLILAAAVLLVLGLVRDLDLLLVVSIVVSLIAAVALYLGARQSRSGAPPDEAVTDPDEVEAGGTDEETTSAGAAVRGSASGRTAGGRALAGMAHRDTADRDRDRDRQREREFADLDPAVDVEPWDGRPPWPLERQASDERDSLAGHDGETASSDRERLAETPGRYGAIVPDGGPADAADDPLDEPPIQRTPRSDADLIARLPADVLVVDGRPRYHVTGCPHLLSKDSEPLPVAEAVELGFSPCGWCQPDTVLLGGTPEL